MEEKAKEKPMAVAGVVAESTTESSVVTAIFWVNTTEKFKISICRFS